MLQTEPFSDGDLNDHRLVKSSLSTTVIGGGEDEPGRRHCVLKSAGSHGDRSHPVVIV